MLTFVNRFNARIAQLVEHDLAKVGVAGSSPVSRSSVSLYKDQKDHQTCQGGGIGRHARLKILWALARAGSIPAPGTSSVNMSNNISVYY